MRMAKPVPNELRYNEVQLYYNKLKSIYMVNTKFQPDYKACYTCTSGISDCGGVCALGELWFVIIYIIHIDGHNSRGTASQQPSVRGYHY